MVLKSCFVIQMHDCTVSEYFLFNVCVTNPVNSLVGVGEIQSSSAESGYHDKFGHLN